MYRYPRAAWRNGRPQVVVYIDIPRRNRRASTLKVVVFIEVGSRNVHGVGPSSSSRSSGKRIIIEQGGYCTRSSDGQTRTVDITISSGVNCSITPGGTSQTNRSGVTRQTCRSCVTRQTSRAGVSRQTSRAGVTRQTNSTGGTGSTRGTRSRRTRRAGWTCCSTSAAWNSEGHYKNSI